MKLINGISIPNDCMLADGLNDAILGYCVVDDQNKVVYSYNMCVEVFLKENRDWGYQDAVEWMDYNVTGAYVGPNTPIFLYV